MKIAFAGGGTLGSVTPLLAVAEEIRRRDPSVEAIWIGTEGGVERQTVESAGLRFVTIRSGKFRRYLSIQNFTDVFRIVAGFGDARKILRDSGIGVVVSAGGFVAVPVVWAARSLGIPIHIHQMDIRPGLANRLSAPFASSFSVAYEKSLSDFANRHPVWTGNPVRPEILGRTAAEGREHFGFHNGLPTVLILGGGTGALSLNRLVAKSAPLFGGEANVIHVVGPGKEAIVPEGTTDYRQFASLDVRQMGLAYAVADLTVTRAGMGTLTELALLGKPTVIVPMPKSHQEDNAEMFRAAGAAAVWPETTLFSKKFAEDVLTLMSNAGRLGSLGEGMKKMNRPDAAARMADVILSAVVGKARA